MQLEVAKLLSNFEDFYDFVRVDLQIFVSTARNPQRTEKRRTVFVRFAYLFSGRILLDWAEQKSSVLLLGSVRRQ